MAETTWKQAVYDIADAYREAEGTTEKISIANLKEKVRDGGGKVYLDGERIKQLEMTSYKGDNPFTIGQDGYVFDPKTLLKDGLTIINGVSGEDLTDTASRQTTSTDILLREVKRKIADHKGEGEYVWKKYDVIPTVTVENPQFTAIATYGKGELPLSDANFDLTLVDDINFFLEFVSTSGDYPKITTYNSDYLGFEYSDGEYILLKSYSNDTTMFSLGATVPMGAPGTYTLAYEGTKTVCPATKGDFLDYIVSSDPEAYPDGAVADDGYWYARVSEGAKYGILYEDIDSSGIARTLIVNAPKGVGFNNILGSAIGASNIEYTVFKGEDVADKAHWNLFSGIGGKMKVFANSLGYGSFAGVGNNARPLKIFIPRQVHTIKGSRDTNSSSNDYKGAFYHGFEITTIYCEHESQPEGFETYWNSYNAGKKYTVTWGVTEEQFDAL